MSYIYLQEQGEVSSVDNFSDIPLSVLSKLRSTQDKSCCNDNETECCLNSLSGTMSAPLTESPGEEQLMLFAEDSPAKTSVQQEREPVSEETVRDYGKNMQELLTRYGLSLSLRKTPRFCGLVALTLSSKTCPSWGMMQSGACWELGTSARPIKETGCGYLQTTHQYMIPTPTTMPEAPNKNANTNGPKNLLEVAQNNWNPGQMWPTPCVSDHNGSGSAGKLRDRLDYAVKRGGTKNKTYDKPQDQTTGRLNPPWVEWLMGWPVGWTDLKPLETDRYRQWQKQHGEF